MLRSSLLRLTSAYSLCPSSVQICMSMAPVNRKKGEPQVKWAGQQLSAESEKMFLIETKTELLWKSIFLNHL